MAEVTYPHVDSEQRRMEQAYALAHQALHSGTPGVFQFYRWGRHYLITVTKNRLVSQQILKKEANV